MTDHFEQAKDRILKEAQLNGGVTTDHLLDALIATNQDLDEKLDEQQRIAKEKHGETRAWHEEVLTLVEDHIEEAKERDRRLDSLEGFRMTTEENCEARIKRICAEDHAKTHSDYIATLADSGKSFSLIERRVWVIWGIFIFIAITLANAVLTFSLDKILHP